MERAFEGQLRLRAPDFLAQEDVETVIQSLKAARVRTSHEFATLPQSAIARVAPGFARELREFQAALRREGARRGRSRSPRRDAAVTFDDFVNAERHRAGFTWVELVVLQQPITAAGVAQALEGIFREADIAANNLAWKKMVGSYANVSKVAGHTFQAVEFIPFERKCRESGCAHLIPPVSLDQTLPQAPRSWRQGPMARIRVAKDTLEAPRSQGPIWPRAVRAPSYLAQEAGVRLQAQSIQGSWKSIASELRAWDMFMKAYFELLPHFPPTVQLVAAFAPHFQNGSSLAKYFGALRFACRWIRVPVEEVVWDTCAAIVRGTKKISETAKRPAVRHRDLRRLVAAAIEERDIESARMYAVAYTFMLRVQSELVPLQTEGFHSKVTIRDRRALLTFRARKNAPKGAEIARTCSCDAQPSAPCGVCAIAAAVAERAAVHPSKTIFAARAFAKRTADLKRRGQAIGLPSLGWHAFRRGHAQDMLASGATLAQILSSGGWKSAAFLSYLQRRDVDERASLEAALANSDSDRES